MSLGRLGLGRLGRELFLVCLGALLVSAVLTWPTLLHPASTVPADLGDPLAQSYVVAWGGHALLTNPAGLWDASNFFPEHMTLAYSDSMLGYAPFGLIGSGPAAALVRYNLLFWWVAALASVSAYALARQLGSRVPGALVAGLAFAYAPWRLAHAGHLNVLSSGGIVLALALLARGFGYSFSRGYQPERVRPGWIIAGWLVACWQVTIGYAIGLPFVYLLLLLCCLVAAARWLLAGRARPALGRPLLWCTLGGGLLFAAVVVVMARPYLAVTTAFPSAVRTSPNFSSSPRRRWASSPRRPLRGSGATPPARSIRPSWRRLRWRSSRGLSYLSSPLPG
ncbi:hypothetical protein [Fodinicola feengrottensis]|uniref:hypothetical protein n=1 Tax=Fodinicola feengrottensis TaxID=435914 RepID=UPI0013D89245|nr:hypothetical protein [Fodinicola feengrottensis]